MSIREKIIKSVCGLCDNGCDVLVHVENERVSKVEGDPESSGYHQDIRNSSQCCSCRRISNGLKEIREEQRGRSVRKPATLPLSLRILPRGRLLSVVVLHRRGTYTNETVEKPMESALLRPISLISSFPTMPSARLRRFVTIVTQSRGEPFPRSKATE